MYLKWQDNPVGTKSSCVNKLFRVPYRIIKLDDLMQTKQILETPIANEPDPIPQSCMRSAPVHTAVLIVCTGRAQQSAATEAILETV